MTADPPRYRPLERFWPYAELSEQPTDAELAALDPDLYEALFGAHKRPFSIVLVDVWMWTPFMLLVSLAALNAIPRYVYEAAEMDRASRWLVFRTITLPMSAPLLGLGVLLRATDALKQFDLVMAITGPNDTSTQTLSARMYQVVFRNYKVGLGSAYGVVILVAVMAVATLFVRYMDYLQRRRGKAEA